MINVCHQDVVSFQYPWLCLLLIGLFSGRTPPRPPTAHPKYSDKMSTNPTPEARGGRQEDQPHIQGAVAARAQEGLEELSHIEGQEGRQ